MTDQLADDLVEDPFNRQGPKVKRWLSKIDPRERMAASVLRQMEADAEKRKAKAS